MQIFSVMFAHSHNTWNWNLCESCLKKIKMIAVIYGLSLSSDVVVSALFSCLTNVENYFPHVQREVFTSGLVPPPDWQRGSTFWVYQ